MEAPVGWSPPQRPPNAPLSAPNGRERLCSCVHKRLPWPERASSPAYLPRALTFRAHRCGEPVIQPRPRTIPEATVARLAVYLRVLGVLADAGRGTVSSGELASAAGVNPAGLRKDLSHLGPCGTRGVGYEVRTLRDRIAGVLGVERSRACVLVGIGNLGAALADYAGFGTRGFEFVGLFDAAASRVGQR